MLLSCDSELGGNVCPFPHCSCCLPGLQQPPPAFIAPLPPSATRSSRTQRKIPGENCEASVGCVWAFFNRWMSLKILDYYPQCLHIRTACWYYIYILHLGHIADLKIYRLNTRSWQSPPCKVTAVRVRWQVHLTQLWGARIKLATFQLQSNQTAQPMLNQPPDS